MTIARAVAASTLALTLALPSALADGTAVTAVRSLALSTPATFDPPTARDAANLQNEGRFGEAAEAWLAVTNADPDNGTAWFNLGYCLHAAGELDHAIEVHQKAAEYEQFRGIALYNLGCAYALTGRKDAAFEALAAAQASGMQLGGGQADGDPDLKSLRSDPRYAALMAAEGGGGRGMGGGGSIAEKLQGIAMHLSEALGASNPELQQQFAVVAERVAMHLQHALQSLLESMAQDDVVAPVLVKLGVFPPEILEGHQGEGGHAEHDEQAEDMKADAAEAHRDTRGESTPIIDARAAAADVRGAFMAAQQAQRSGDFGAAARGFAMVLEADPDNVQAHFGHAYSLHMKGDYEKAIAAHRAAAEYAPIRGIALYNLACAYALTGKTDSALEALAASRDAGFDVAGSARGDSDLDSIRSDARFDAIVNG